MKKLAALVLVGLVAGGLMKVEAQAVPPLDAIKTDAELTSTISRPGDVVAGGIGVGGDVDGADETQVDYVAGEDGIVAVA